MGLEWQCSNIENIPDGIKYVKAMLGNSHLRGMKRKLDEEQYPDSLDYTSTMQRQSVFNISICKLSRFRQVADPCLLQSVLICNTLRHIEKEFEQDGIRLPYNPSSMIDLPALNSQAIALDPSPNSLHVASSGSSIPLANSESLKYYVVSSVVTNGSNSIAYSEYDRYLHELDNAGRKTPFIRTANDRNDTGALCYEESDRLTSLNWSSVLNFATLGNGGPSLTSDYAYTCTTGNSNASELNPSLHTLLPPASVSSPVAGNSSILPSIMLNFTNSSTISSANLACSPTGTMGSSTSSNGDEIFGDIDLSLYDFDLLSPLSPPNIKTAPVTAEELMKSLTGNAESTLCKQEA